MDPEPLARLLGILGPTLLGIGLLVAVRLGLGRSGSAGGDSIDFLHTVAGWVMIAVSLTGTLLYVFHVFGFLLWIAMLFLWLEIHVRNRAAQRYSLLWMLTVAAERLIPLAPAVEAFGRERGGRFGRRAARLAETLEAGTPLPDALQRSRGLVPREALPLIRVGCETGTLAAALRHACTTRNTFEPLRYSLASKLAYLAWILWFTLAVVTFVMLKIVPAFQKIFDDFEVELPELTQLLVFVADMTRGLVGFMAYAMVPLLLLAAVLCYMGLGRWRLPGLRFVVDRLDAAVVLDALSLVTRQGRPILDAITSLSLTYPRKRIRRRMDRVRQDVESGVDWCESLRLRRMIGQADLAVLQAAARVGNVPWALGEMADSIRRRTGYRLNAVLQVIFPMVIIALGVGVMFIVAALFMPLITLIEALI